MIVFNDIRLHELINFRTHADSVLGTDFNGCRIVAVLDADAARAHISVESQHAAVYPYIPKSLAMPNDPEAYSYYKVKLASGQYTAVGEPWVNKDTATRVSDNKYAFNLIASGGHTLESILKVLETNAIEYERKW